MPDDNNANYDEHVNPNDDKLNADDANLGQDKAKDAPSPADRTQVDDNRALDDELENTATIINNNYFITGNNIFGSAIGTASRVVIGKPVKENTAGDTSTDEIFVSDLNWDIWFRNKKLHEQTFIVSLLFFSGNSPRFVESMGNELARLLGGSTVPASEKSSIFENRSSIGSLAKDGIIKINRETINSEAGKLEFDSIRIENNQAFSTVRQIILTDYDLISLRTVVRRWLVNLIKSDNSKILELGSVTPDLTRIQAGLGIGLLARTELDALPLVIRPWANSENPNDRLMVGWILLGYFEEDCQSTYWSTVSSLLKHWASLNNYYLRWTAIASTTRLGLIVSPKDDASLVLSLSIFKEVCKSGQVNLFGGMFRGVLLKSLRFLFGLSEYHARTITIELASWLEDDNSLLADLAAELFIEIVGVTIVEDNDQGKSLKISIWELCESESYTLSEAVYKLVHQALLHQKGTFVDYTVMGLSKSFTKLLERDILPEKRVVSIFDQLRSDSRTAKYVPLILKDSQYHRRKI